MKQTQLFDPEKAARKRGGLLAEDLARELLAPREWVEESRWRLPHRTPEDGDARAHHPSASGGGWFVVREELEVWREAWERANGAHTDVTRDRPDGSTVGLPQ